MSIEEKRHHRERLKKKRRNYWGCVVKDERRLGILVNTPKPCSCFMCRNRRKDEGPTLQERRNEVPDGYWPALVSVLKSSQPVLDGGDDSDPLV